MSRARRERDTPDEHDEPFGFGFDTPDTRSALPPMRRRGRRWPWFLGGAVVLVTVVGLVSTIGGAGTTVASPTGATALGGTTSQTADPTQAPVETRTATPVPTQTPTGDPGTAIAALATLTVKGKAAVTGYDRDRFGPAWADVDGNGCDTRDDILARDLTDTVVDGSCEVRSGTLVSPYTAASMQFTRGWGTSSEVQIDHVVALANAWRTGASSWTAARLQAFANDPLNLFAVDGPSNQQKQDGDAATWLPANKSFRCVYVAHQVAVKAKYELSVAPAERDAIARVLGTCPDAPLPTESSVDARSVVSKPDPSPALRDPVEPSVDGSPEQEAPVPFAPAPAPAGTATSYANCTAVRAAGAAPIRSGDPGYSRKLDRDGDGVGCE